MIFKKPDFIHVLQYLVLALAYSAPGLSGELYEYVVDMDSVTCIPASKLNALENPDPIMAQDRIYVKDGHFYTVGSDLIENTGDEKRVRFWGVNITPPTTFLSQAQADDLAERFEKMGFNIVRLHSLFSSAYKTTPNKSLIDLSAAYPSMLNALSPDDNLDMLDRLIDAFSQRGIYVEIPLNMGYTFTPMDCYLDDQSQSQCVPDPSITVPGQYPNPGVMPGGNRPLDHFNQEMIELQKRHYDELLNHYASHPAVAMFEVNNESSLIEIYKYTAATETKALPPLYAQELDDLWNDWLLNTKPLSGGQKGYGTTAALTAAWQPESNTGIPDINFSNGDFSVGMTNWLAENFNVSSTCPEVPEAVSEWGSGQVTSGELALRLNTVSCTWWWFLTGQRGLTFELDSSYLLTFTVRTDISRKIRVSLQALNNSSLPVMDTQEFNISNQSATFSICFSAKRNASNARLAFIPNAPNQTAILPKGSDGGTVWISNVSLSAGSASGLLAGETLNEGDSNATGNVRRLLPLEPRCPQNSVQRNADYLEFLTYLESKYFVEMKDHLKTIVGNKPVTGTQATYGGLMSREIQAADMDFLDTHFYWDSSKNKNNVGGVEWWRNDAMVDNAKTSIASHLSSINVANKPLIVTEYGMPNGNQFTEESLPMVASYAALQDIDGIFAFTYNSLGGNFDSRENLVVDAVTPPAITHEHNMLRDARRETLSHLAANIFRRGDVASANNTLNLYLNKKSLSTQTGINNSLGMRSIQGWMEQTGNILDVNGKSYDARIGLQSRIQWNFEDSGVNPQSLSDYFPLVTAQHESDTGELLWNDAASESYLMINTPRTQAITGHIGNRTLTMDNVEVIGAELEDFGTIAMTSMDGEPIAVSSEMLVTSIGLVKNHPMMLTAEGAGFTYCWTDSAGEHCGGGWHANNGPVDVEAKEATIKIRSAATTVSVELLDNESNAVGAVSVIPITDTNDPFVGGYQFNVGSVGDHTPWYQITTTLPVPHVLQAENGLLSGNGNVVVTASANANSYVVLRSTGSFVIDVPANLDPGKYYIVLDTRGLEDNGPASVQLSVNNNASSSTVLRLPDVLGRSWQSVSGFPTPIALNDSPLQQFTISFASDATRPNLEFHLNAVRFYRADTQPHSDMDGDGIVNGSLAVPADNCPLIANVDQLNQDGDVAGNVCDVFPFDPAEWSDSDADDIGNNADPDDDNDGILDANETNTGVFNTHADTGTDPLIADTDGDGVGDGIEVEAGTNPNNKFEFPVFGDGDVNNDGRVNVADLILSMQILLGQVNPTPLQIVKFDVAPLFNGVPMPDGQITAGDYLVLARKVLGLINF